MECSSTSWRTGGWAILVGVLTISGCARMRLPAIDPSGQRLILPPPSYTSLASPPDVQERRGPLRPAFVAPPDPPPCDPAEVGAVAVPQPPVAAPAVGPGPVIPVAPPGAPAPRPGCGQFYGALQLTPSRLVAPVGSDVILRAGLCGEGGYFIERQPIEWMLSRDSVGTFVDVNTQGRSFWRRIRTGWTQAKSSDYAVGWTSTTAQLLSRGTPTPTDDVHVLEGQTWIRLTSATEGASHVTAHAPSAADWNERRKTATIHWVDGQWTFPPPTTGRAGQPVSLTTNVRRHSTGAPIEGWHVRYQITGGPPAALDGNGVQVVEVATDREGNASVDVTPQTAEPGVTQIAVQIIRIASATGDLPRLSLGEATTSVTWSAPGLNVRTRGPSVAELNSTVTYQIDVANTGDIPARDVTVSSEIPFGLEFAESSPPGQMFGNRIQWRIDQLAALELRSFVVHFRATRPGEVNYCATASLADGTTRESCATTVVSARSLSLRVEGPEQARVGDRIQFRIEVANDGDQALTNLLVIDRFDPGFRHFDPDRPEATTPSPIERSLGSLAPGQSKRFAVTFVVQSTGRLCHTLEVTASEGVSETAQQCITATEGPPSVAIRNVRVGPEQRVVDDVVEFSIEISNDGHGPMTNVRVQGQFDSSLQPVEATNGWSRTDNQLVWQYDQIFPGQIARLTVRCRCVAASPRACATVTVTADQGVQGAEGSCVQILPRSEPPPGREAEPPDVGRAPSDESETRPPDFAVPPLIQPNGNEGQRPAPSGRLAITVDDLGDPIRAGDEVKYVIEVKNERDAPEKNVILTVVLPEARAPFRVTPPVPLIRYDVEGRNVRFTPIKEMRAGETLTFTLDVTLQQPGRAVLQAMVTSDSAEQPISTQEETTVFAK